MGERETVTAKNTAKAWHKRGSWSYRMREESREWAACTHAGGWAAWTSPGKIVADAGGLETGQQGRDAADAALRAVGVVLL